MARWNEAETDPVASSVLTTVQADITEILEERLPAVESSGPATLTYSAPGVLATAASGNAEITDIAYDEQGRMESFEESINGGDPVTRTLTYDPATGDLTGVS